jgi:hypothetical protein
MSGSDWRWKIGEVAERLRTRYEHIGRKTGAPFLAFVYPPEAEASVLREWHTVTDSLRPDIDVRSINVIEVTQDILNGIGAEEVVAAIRDPMPGSDPTSDLGRMWIDAIANRVKVRLSEPGDGKPVVSLEYLAALFPAAAPRDLMQILWDSAQSELDGPVVVLIPGESDGTRTYSFLGKINEFMYRGDLL